MSIQCTSACPLLIAIVGVDGMTLKPLLGTEKEEVPVGETVSCLLPNALKNDVVIELNIVRDER